MPILELKNVSKSFGQLKVTDDVSVAVPEGEALASSVQTAREIHAVQPDHRQPHA
jgi:ABC-type phosphonate transport system ATPase subunit